jgi:16S rRNA pseudouridine516 synthase
MRLDKYLSDNSELTRSRIQVAIKQGQVKVDGTLARKGDQKISGQEAITLNNVIIEPSYSRYYMLHKPSGYICANQDADHPTVMDLIELPNKHKLQIVGRLDIDTTGLVLLTDDGDWNHRITSPRHKCIKVYRLTTADPISVDAAALFLTGVQLQGEAKPTLPATLEQLDSHSARLSIQEGKYHQVKRMLAAIGNRVTSLHREAIGNISLDPTLAPGKYRALSLDELRGV